jgi:hypothetical protein
VKKRTSTSLARAGSVTISHWVQSVDPPGPGRSLADQAGVLEDLQMLRHRGSGDRQLGGQFADGHRVIGQARDDRPTRGISQRAHPSHLGQLH